MTIFEPEGFIPVIGNLIGAIIMAEHLAICKDKYQITGELYKQMRRRLAIVVFAAFIPILGSITVAVCVSLLYSDSSIDTYRKSH